MTSEPVRTVLLPIALAAFAAAAQAFLDGAPTRGIVTAVLGALVVAAQEYARSQVTPAPTDTSRAGAGTAGGDRGPARGDGGGVGGQGAVDVRRVVRENRIRESSKPSSGAHLGRGFRRSWPSTPVQLA